MDSYSNGCARFRSALKWLQSTKLWPLNALEASGYHLGDVTRFLPCLALAPQFHFSVIWRLWVQTPIKPEIFSPENLSEKLIANSIPFNRPVSFNLIQLLKLLSHFRPIKMRSENVLPSIPPLVKYSDELLSSAIFPLSLPDSYPIFRPLRTCWDHGTSFNFLPSTPSLIAWRHCLE